MVPVKMDDKYIELFHLYKNDIYRLSFSYTKSLTDADDITQNVFVKLFKHPEILELDLIESKKWLIRVTINECKTFLLSSWKKKIFPISDDIDKVCDGNQDSNDILSTVLSLPKKYRLLVYLYYYEGYKIKEISSLIHLSETNVQTRLSRARGMLREILKGEWENER